MKADWKGNLKFEGREDEEDEAGKDGGHSQVKEEVVESFLRDAVVETNWKKR